MADAPTWNYVKAVEDEFFAILSRKQVLVDTHDPHATGVLPASQHDLFLNLVYLLDKEFLRLSLAVEDHSAQHPHLSARDVEDQFRKENRNVYLLARPFDRCKLKTDTNLYFGGKEGPYMYNIEIVGTKAITYYQDRMRRCGISSIEENRDNLVHSGFLSVPSRSASAAEESVRALCRQQEMFARAGEKE